MVTVVFSIFVIWGCQIAFLKRILVIEDNELIRCNTLELLEVAGYEVCMACNGEEGLAAAKQELPALILCDILMPVMDGYSVLSAVRSYEPLKSTPFIFLTAYSEQKEMDKGLVMGANDYIVKPFDADVLIEKIARLLR